MRVIGVDVPVELAAMSPAETEGDNACMVLLGVVCPELEEVIAAVEMPVVVAKAVSTSCESRKSPALSSIFVANGAIWPIIVEVVALSVDVAPELEASGIAS